jgi:hypothetical protein
MASASDLLAAMSGFRPDSFRFPPGPDVPGNPGIRGKMTQPGHGERHVRSSAIGRRVVIPGPDVS